MSSESSSLNGAAVAINGTPGGRTASEVRPQVAAIARTEGREARIRRLGFKDYATFLRSDRWREKRAEYWSDPDTLKVCAICGADEPPLPLHHRTYERVGAERLEDLTPVCPTCHQLVHALERRGDLSGLDADLAILVDRERAKRYRDARGDEVRPSSINLRQRKSIEARIADDEQAVASAERRKHRFKREAAERRIKRGRTRLLWLRQHPQRSLSDFNAQWRGPNATPPKRKIRIAQ